MFYKFMYIEVYTMFILRQLSQFCQVDFKWDELKHPVINLRNFLVDFLSKKYFFFALKVSKLVVLLCWDLSFKSLSTPI